MLQEERHSRILSLLHERGFIKVEDLSNVLGVSEMTIRRDLEKCQKSGLLRRSFGGAVLPGNRHELSFEDKSTANSEAKKHIARRCASLVQEGMSVFLDAGTTVFEIAQELRGRDNLTVVTNDIRTANDLMSSGLDVLIIGGTVQKPTGSVIGQLAYQMVQGLFFDIAFLGVNSINEQMEDMTPTLEKVFFKRQVRENSSACYLAADHSKFHSTALHRVNCLSAYTGVVTEYAFTVEEQRVAREKGIRIVPAASSGAG